MTLEIEQRGYADPDVVALVAAVQLEYVRRYGGPDGAAVQPGEFAPPHGLFLVGLADGMPVAMGGWRRLDPVRAEIKRMYVVEAARRRGFAGQMLAALEQSATAAGITELVLNTGPQQPEAIALYESRGYLPVPAFGHYQHVARALFYGKDVGAAANTSARNDTARLEHETGR